MPDHLLSKNDQEEALSRAYAHAIAAGAGYIVSEMDFDRDGVDLIISAGGQMRPSIAIELKATMNLSDAGDVAFRYALKKRNYELLRIETQTPRVLVVLALPNDENCWLSH